ncbi:MAG: hypothetical protein ACJAWY_000897 [Sphingomonas echinoides]|jgi:hypothetical protein
MTLATFSFLRHPGLVLGSTVPIDQRRQNVRRSGPRDKPGVTERAVYKQ